MSSKILLVSPVRLSTEVTGHLPVLLRLSGQINRVTRKDRKVTVKYSRRTQVRAGQPDPLTPSLVTHLGEEQWEAEAAGVVDIAISS